MSSRTAGKKKKSKIPKNMTKNEKKESGLKNRRLQGNTCPTRRQKGTSNLSRETKKINLVVLKSQGRKLGIKV